MLVRFRREKVSSLLASAVEVSRRRVLGPLLSTESELRVFTVAPIADGVGGCWGHEASFCKGLLGFMRFPGSRLHAESAKC